MKKYLIIMSILYSFCDAVAQPNIDNGMAHRRYWFYRTRLVNDFMRIGTQQGDCIVFAERNLGSTDHKAKVGTDQIDQINMYLATLALEFKLLSRANQSTQETVKEIYNILETYNRLYEEADQFWGIDPPVFEHITRINFHRNGFMLREDMPKDYLHPFNYYKDFNYSLKEYNNNPNLVRSYSGLDYINNLDNDNPFSDYENFPNGDESFPKTDLPLVHDKYYSMFFAFMFLVKYIPPNVTYFQGNQQQVFADGETSILQEVKNITNRCHQYLRGNTFESNASDWIMEYPDGDNLNPFVQGTPNPLFLFPLINTVCHINNNYPWNYPCTAYSDIISIAPPSVQAYTLISSTNAFSMDASVFLAYNHASSNVYPGPMPLWLKMMQNTSFWNVEWADLARKVLHQTGQLTRQKSVYANPISQAPCVGPYNFFGNCNLPGCEWSATDRIEHPNRRSAGCPSQKICHNKDDDSFFPGNYPGVDYMLLHNLYYEYLNQEDDGPGPAEAGAYKTAINLMDNYDEQIWPRQIITNPGGGNQFNQNGLGQNITIGVDANIATINNPPGPGGPVFTVKQPARIKLFQNLESRAQIYASASPAALTNTIPSKVEYRAGKEISLMPEIGGQPGFEVKLGSDFTAYIQRYICSGNSDPLQMKQNPNDENNRNNDYENDDMNTEVPIHYVQGPKSDSDLYPNGNENEEAYSAENTVDVQNALVEQYNIANDNNNQNQITSLENIAAKQRFIALPNPNNGVFKVYANRIADNEVFELIVYDMKGQMILNYKNLKDNVSLEIDLSNYSEGIYMLHLNSSLGGKLIKKVTVIK